MAAWPSIERHREFPQPIAASPRNSQTKVKPRSLPAGGNSGNVVAEPAAHRDKTSETEGPFLPDAHS